MKDYSISDFETVQFLTAVQKFKAYKKFKSVIKKRDINLMDKNLYQHLNLHCGYIAHYDINGFRATYEDPHDFLRFCNYFIKHNSKNAMWGVMAEYRDINYAMSEIVEQHIDGIRQEVEGYQNKQELDLLHRLAEKHGFRIEEPVKAGKRMMLL